MRNVYGHLVFKPLHSVSSKTGLVLVRSNDQVVTVFGNTFFTWFPIRFPQAVRI